MQDQLIDELIELSHLELEILVDLLYSNLEDMGNEYADQTLVHEIQRLGLRGMIRSQRQDVDLHLQGN